MYVFRSINTWKLAKYLDFSSGSILKGYFLKIVIERYDMLVRILYNLKKN